MKKTLLALNALLFLSAFSGPARGLVQFSSLQANIACFPKENMADVIQKKQSYGLRVVPDGDISHQSLLVGVIDRLAKLGIQPSLISNVTVHLVNQKSTGKACASESPGGGGGTENVILVVGCGFSAEDSAKHFAHEMGHVIGHRAGMYQKYFAGTSPCHITNYAGSSRNEEFGEVIATYQASPDILKSKCPAQYDWVHRFVFNNGPNAESNCNGDPNAPVGGGAPFVLDEPDTKGPGGNKLGLQNQLGGFMPLLESLMRPNYQPVPAAPPQPVLVPLPVQAMPAAPAGPVNPWPGQNVPAAR